MTDYDETLFRHIGRPLPRKEDERLLRGQGEFTDDFSVAGQLYAAMVRSPFPHARIRGIDAGAARASPGVAGIFTGADCAADGLGAIPHSPVPSTKYDMKLTGPGGGEIFIGPHVPLPADKVRHVGEAVAMVVAESQARALDAVELVEVEYEELPQVTESWEAIRDGAPSVWDEAPDNVLVETVFGDQAATDAAFVTAAHVIRARYHVGRVTAVALEPRAALAEYNSKTGSYTLYAGSGGAVRQRREIAETLGIEPERLRVISPDVGGNFGSKNRVYPEFVLILWAARKLGRPVKYTAVRSESFVSDYQGRDLVTAVELALDADGRFLAMRADNLSNVGARCVSLSPLGKGSALITGSYDIPAATLRARAVFTNTTPTQAYRSSGRPEVTFAIERLIEKAARECGFDALELRRRNLVRADQMPFTNAVGARYDSGDYRANMDRALEMADWKGFEARRRDTEARGKLRGRGFANYVESSIGAPRERAEITVKAEGTVEVVIGTQPSGQGHETSFAQVVADLLQVPAKQVRIVFGDTDVVSVGGGSHSGRSMRHAATVMSMAAADLIAEGRRKVAERFGESADAVTFEDGSFHVAGTNHVVELFELARGVPPDAPLRAVRDNEMHDPVFPNGAAACEVEVDPETGTVEITRYVAVDDVGRCINPLIVEGQAHGAVAQGVGQAMWELCYVDPASGQPLSGSLMDYALPRADSLPPFLTEIVEVLSPTNPLGIKAGGEGGTTPALAVVVNAIVDALKSLGVTDVPMPATPFAVWRAIRDAKAKMAQEAHHGESAEP